MLLVFVFGNVATIEIKRSESERSDHLDGDIIVLALGNKQLILSMVERISLDFSVQTHISMINYE